MKQAYSYRMMAAAAIAALGLAVTAGVAGCASVDFTPPPTSSSTAASEAGSVPMTSGVPASDTQTSSVPVTGAVATTPASGSPGVVRASGGMATVRGTLVHKDLEGGIYVIVDSLPGAGADTAKTLAVVSDPDRFPFGTMVNTYVQAFGTLDETAVSANMAGPQLVVMRVEPAKQ